MFINVLLIFPLVVVSKAASVDGKQTCDDILLKRMSLTINGSKLLNLERILFHKHFSFISVQTCNVDGTIYQLLGKFESGINGCAKCVCIDIGVKCDVKKCHEIAMNQLHPVLLTNASAPNDFANIKDQIAKQFFAEYDPQRLKIITEKFGCKSIECPELLAATKIDYSIANMVEKQYIGRGKRINKIVFHSTDTEAVNNSPSQQVITTIPFSLTFIQSFELKISKTKQITSNGKGKNLWVYKTKTTITFTQQEEETRSETNETTILFASQNVNIAPLTRMNVSFNFFQYDDINNYFLDFEIDNNSTFRHPDVDVNSTVITTTSPLTNFLRNHIDFLSTLKYENENMLKLQANDGKFVLRNFPASEKMTNYGVDVVFGKAKNI